LSTHRDRAFTVAVIGAGGRIAPAVVRDLAESEQIGAAGDLGGSKGAAKAVSA
jgi:hypothetical protein